MNRKQPINELIEALDGLYTQSMDKTMNRDHSYTYYVAFCDIMESEWPRISAELKEYERNMTYTLDSRDAIIEERDRYKREADLLREAMQRIAIPYADFMFPLPAFDLSNRIDIAKEALSKADKIRGEK